MVPGLKVAGCAAKVAALVLVTAVLTTSVLVTGATAKVKRGDGPAPTDELSCLARAIYFEARGEPEEGQMAVGRVILNRTRSSVYPTTICGVVYENRQRHNRCQFSFACDGKPDRIADLDSWGVILYRAAVLMAQENQCSDETASAGPIAFSTHYHATYVAPRWSRLLQQTAKIGRHVFYVEERALPVEIATVADAKPRALARKAGRPARIAVARAADGTRGAPAETADGTGNTATRLTLLELPPLKVSAIP